MSADAPDADILAAIGHPLIGRDGVIGTVVDVYLDDATGQPVWLAVETGDEHGPVSFVPMADSAVGAEGLTVPFLAEEVDAAPKPVTDGALTREEEAALYRHYGLSEPVEEVGPGADDGITRSEEELHVSKTAAEAGRVRLRKWVETDHVIRTVPVAREQVRIEREPITIGDEEAPSGAQIGEAEFEVVLHEEQVTATKVTVPKERVRLQKEVVVDQQQVAADLRKEHVEVERDGPADPLT